MRKITGFVLVLWLVHLFFSGWAFAGSLGWTCPVCKETFNFDPRDSGYRNSFAQQHLAMHQSSRSSAAQGSPGYGSGVDPAFDVMMPFFNQVCQSIGTEIAKGIFGPDPAEQQQINTEMAALRAQQQAAALEQERLKEERHQKLLSSLKTLPGTQGSLALKTLDEDSGQLLIKEIPNQSVSGGSALDNLKRAAFLMEKAAGTSLQQDAAFYSEQAFLAAEGGNIDVQVPAIGPSSAVTEKDADAFLKMKLELDKSRKDFIAISDKLAVEHRKQEAFSKARTLIADKVKNQEQKVKALSQNVPPAEKSAEEQKLAEARKLLDEANQHADKAEKDFKELQKESGKINSEILQKKREQEKFLLELGKR